MPGVNRFTVIAAVGVVMTLAGGLAYLSLRPAPKPAAALRAASAPAPRPAAAPPKAETPPVVPPAASTRRRAAARPEAASAAAPAPAETPVAGGTLRIESDVDGAQVFIDREYVGVTPLTANGLAPGSHRVNVSAQGYEGFSETIDVAAGSRELRVTFKDVRLAASLPVVHKHRFGSCRGRLVATPQGLRYETSDKGDAFTAGLLDLGAFQVDYLEKNLRLTLRSGKRYDFTDPEGNADHLFVFHRDVEKARERLKKGDRPAQP